MKKGFLNKEILGWSLFDFANSSYTTVIITVVFSRYFVKVVVDDSSGNYGEYLWGMTLSISYALVVLFSPIVGAIADYSGNKKKYLIYAALWCIVFTMLLYFIERGDLYIAMLFIILSNFGYSMTENLISSFLPEITTSENIGKVSGFGWGLGYFGGILSLIISILILQWIEEGEYAVRVTCILIGVFFGLSALPSFLWLKERGLRMGVLTGMSGYTKIGYQRLKDTLIHLKDFKELIKLLIAYFFYYAGLMTVISYAAIYAEKVFHFKDTELIIMIIVINLTSSVGAFLFGYVQDKIGAKISLIISVLLWVGTILGIYYTTTQTGFWIMANIAGIGIGSTQSATRALVGLFSPSHKLAEFYGFWGFFGKLSSILGLYSFGLLSYILNSQRLALLSTLILFILGLILLFLIKESEGISHAKEYNIEN